MNGRKVQKFTITLTFLWQIDIQRAEYMYLNEILIQDNKLVQENNLAFLINIWNMCMTGYFWRIFLPWHLWELVKQCSFSVPFTGKAAKQKFGVGHVICLQLLSQHFPCHHFPCDICHLLFKVLPSEYRRNTCLEIKKKSKR